MRICRIATAAHERLKTAEEKRFRGSIVEPPWKQTREIGTARAKVQNSRRYARLIRSGFTANCKRLRWQETCNGTPAPCDLKVEKKQKLLVTEVDTHTYGLGKKSAGERAQARKTHRQASAAKSTAPFPPPVSLGRY